MIDLSLLNATMIMYRQRVLKSHCAIHEHPKILKKSLSFTLILNVSTT